MTGHDVSDTVPLRADLIIEYPFIRTTGPVVGAFLTGLREAVLVGIRRVDGTVMVPPVEYDPVTSESLTEVVEVSSTGTIVSWTWVDPPRPGSPWDTPHGLALVLLDGADTPLLHGVLVDSADELATGLRVEAVWRDERVGHITDLVGFAPVARDTSEGS
ncbi:MAG: OB-fold domain-containing protein [Acidimicrobiales bacterium]|nr:OB-fold domain-containing protein [Acidimicrobiales bacterium]